jgi:putative transposase
MAEYRRGAHTVFEIHLHLVWITKYRRPALQGEIATTVRDLIRDICGQHDVSIMGTRLLLLQFRQRDR